MTIDLGFAWLTLADGTDVGIVDVPGHQDFIRNMLAGIGGIDAVILVVAADESVMPQTREHLAILSLLGIERGVIALTKRDLVDDDWAALVRDEVRAAVRGSALAHAPLVEVSATSGAGLETLVARIGEVLGASPARRDLGRPRLPVDRAFTMSGFGTVVTGTLLDGTLEAGEEVELVPSGKRARVRGLQTHKRAIAEAQPGSRVAANLTGIDKDELARGMVVARPGTLQSTSIASLHLQMLASASAGLGHDDLVRVHAGTAEAMARATVLESAELAPGDAGWVQLRLADPLALAVGDRVVVRRPSPSETLGGGVIADTTGARARRRAETVAELERRSAPSPAARLLAVLDDARTAQELAERAGIGAAERDAALAELVGSGAVVPLADAFLSRGAVDALALRVERTLAKAHRSAPLRAGAPREEIRAAVGLPPKRWAALLERLVAEGRVAVRASLLALPGHAVHLAPEQEERWTRARAALAAAPLQPPSTATLETEYGIDRELLAAIAERGDVVRVGADAAFLPEAVLRFGLAVVDELARSPAITVSRARDLTGSSRKHVLPLLGFLDDLGITRRAGDDRILVPDPAAAREKLARAVRREGT
jgi:selenocysteine-specific elongation factor